MQRLIITLAAAGFAAALGAAALESSAMAQTPAPAGTATHGRQIYTAYGCWQCHGYQGQGSAAGPKLAPSPLPFEAVSRQLRKPRDRMPIYTSVTVPDSEVADIYAYLSSIPKAKA